MSKQPPFIPGRPEAPEPPLAPYRPQQPAGAAGDYVRSLTPPGGLIVDLFCQGPRYVGEALSAGRRAIGFNVNPLLLNAARLYLAPPDHQALDAGFTHLADSLKGDRPLRSHLISLYRTRCPACRSEGTAEWFAWRRDLEQPFEKRVRCQRCGEVQIGPTDVDDVERAQSFASRGLSYYYALDRAAPLRHPVRERAAELVDCYTPRNLSALMDLSRRLEGIAVATSVRTALISLLLDCFDRCSKLYTYDEDRARPRTLRIPPRYLERNVWLCLERGLSRLQGERCSSPVPESKNVAGLVDGVGPGYALVASAAREVGEVLPLGSADLVIVEPPRPDGVFWALSALWAAWLWNSPEARAMRPFLRRRRFDWHWHWQALHQALSVIGPCLTDAGFLIALFGAGDRAMLESFCLAAAGAGYQLRAWGYAPEIGYRLAWRWEGGDYVQPAVVKRVAKEAVAEVEATTVRTLRRRGEPSSEALLHAAAHTRLAEEGCLKSIAGLDGEISPMDLMADAVERGFEAASMVEVAPRVKQRDRLWWLPCPGETEDALADRVEASVRQLLAEQLVWRESDLINAVYARFSGPLTPDLTLVRVCIASYSTREGREVRLRAEDDLNRRRLEIDQVRDDLAALGDRLGFETSGDAGWDVRWLEDEQAIYLFIVSATAALAPRLLSVTAPGPAVACCLVVPGGRAELIDLKLRRDPRLRQAVDSGQWQFIKFRHLRRLVAEEDLDRYAFKIVVGLDPIAEQEHAQLALL